MKSKSSTTTGALACPPRTGNGAALFAIRAIERPLDFAREVDRNEILLGEEVVLAAFIDDADEAFGAGIIVA